MMNKIAISSWKEEITVVLTVCIGSFAIILSNFFFGSMSSLINYCVLLLIAISGFFWLEKEPWRANQSERLSFSETGQKTLSIVKSLEESPTRAVMPLLALVFTISISGFISSLFLIGSLILGLAAAGIIAYYTLRTRMIDLWTMIVAIVLIFALIVWKIIQTITFYESIVLPENISFEFFLIASISLFSFFCIVIAGLLLVKNTGLTRVNLLEKELSPLLKSVGIGLFLAIPWGLVSAGISFNNKELKAYWWQPLIIFVPGLNEEIWARLFIIPITYLSLRFLANTEEHCWGTIIFAAIIQAVLPLPIVIWLEYLPYLLRTALFWGIPLGYLFIRRDFETVLSFHLMTEALPLVLFLITS